MTQKLVKDALTFFVNFSTSIFMTIMKADLGKRWSMFNLY